MRLRMMQVVFVLAVLLFLYPGGAWAQGVETFTGTLDQTHDGATYLIQVPSNWNGFLFLYSHGYDRPDRPNPPVTDAGGRNLDPAALNVAAAALGPLNTFGGGNVIPSAFVDFHPAQYLRPFDGEAEECEFESPCREH